jgi:nicotinate-nucleotide adenylyltransferase
MTTIGFYGGTFDPPHGGHVAVARWAVVSGSLDRLLIAPVYEHPLGKRASASFADRVAMCAIAFDSCPRVEISEIERELGGVSRTLRTLEALSLRHPDARFRLVIGADVLDETHRWHRWDDIVAIARPLVAGRAGHDASAGSPPLFDANSTKLRDALSSGERPRDLVDPRVLDYIDRHGLYQGRP